MFEYTDVVPYLGRSSAVYTKGKKEKENLAPLTASEAYFLACKFWSSRTQRGICGV